MTFIRIAPIALICAAVVFCQRPAYSQSYQLNGVTVSKSEYDGAMVFNESRQLLQQKKWEQAGEKLKQALELNPGLRQARNNLGIVLVRQGKYQEAIEVLQVLVKEDPSQSMGWATLGGAYQSVGKIEDAADAYKRFLALKPDYPEAPRFKDLVRGLEAEAAKRKAMGDAPEAETYLKEASPNGIKWASVSEPIKVYVPKTSTASGYLPQYETIMINAFKKWETATSGRVRFQFVTNPADAQITCDWTDDSRNAIYKAEGGHAHIEGKGDNIGNVKIILLTTSSKNLPISDNFIDKLSLHEIGHSLGLIGHSSNRADIMFYSIDISQQEGQVSLRDAKTLCALYQ